MKRKVERSKSSGRTEPQERRLESLGVPRDQWPETLGRAGALIARIEIERGLRKKPTSQSSRKGKNLGNVPKEPEEIEEQLPRDLSEIPDPREQAKAWLREQQRFQGDYALLALSSEDVERFTLMGVL